MSLGLDQIKREIRNGQYFDMSKLSSFNPQDIPLKDSVPLKILDIKQPEVGYEERSAVRVIIRKKISPGPKIAIMFSNRFNCYKLPGGEMEQADIDEIIATGDHAHHIVARRESMEETGIEIGVFHQQCCGVVEEWPGDLHQMNYLYCVDIQIEGGERHLDDAEMGDLEKFEWVGIEEAVDKMSKVEPAGEMGNSIKERDLFFVRAFATFGTC